MVGVGGEGVLGFEARLIHIGVKSEELSTTGSGLRVQGSGFGVQGSGL